QPRHAIERLGSDWTDPGQQVVSGAFRIASRDDDALALERAGPSARPGNVARVEYVHEQVTHALGTYAAGDLDRVPARYTARLAALVAEEVPDARLGAAAWSGYLAFDHTSEPTSNLDLRLALAHAVDREALAASMPVNVVLATGGIVPPALQRHPPAITLPFDPSPPRRHPRPS